VIRPALTARAHGAKLLMSALLALTLACPVAASDAGQRDRAHAGNPVIPGWYADPEAAIFGKDYWIYPTWSDDYDRQLFFDAFSSPDLVKWTRHPHVLDVRAIRWAKRAMWAPAVVAKDGRYYLFFAANDIQSDRETGGIGVAVANRPDGPFRDLLGKPLVGAFHNGAQPIDQSVFRDDDGQYYLIYGGWKHANIARLKDDFTGFVPFEDGTVFKEITPEHYVEGPMMFKRVGKILRQDPAIATGAGHHSLLHTPDGRWYIVYHRRPRGETAANHRVVCIDRLEFDARGRILPVRMTEQGVEAHPLR
jgi:beta-xylosidase